MTDAELDRWESNLKYVPFDTLPIITEFSRQLQECIAEIRRLREAIKKKNEALQNLNREYYSLVKNVQDPFLLRAEEALAIGTDLAK